MDRISAPPQNALLGRLADLLRLAETGAAGGPEFLPKGLDVMNLVRQLALPSAETVEKLSYGDPLFRMAPSGTGSRIPMTTNREYLADVAGMVPIAAPAARPSARGMQELVRQIQTEPPVGAVNLPPAPGLLEKSNLGFYSQLEAAVQPLQNKGTGQQYLAQIQKSAGVKPEEIQWTGLDEFLKGKKSVTKQEIQDYLQANRVDVREVRLSDEIDPEEVRLFMADEAGEGFTYDEAVDYLRDGDSVTKFSKFTLPGGENYREILLTLPETGLRGGVEAKEVGNGWFAAFKDGQQIEDTLARSKNAALEASGFWKKQQDFRSTHFDQPNILAHMRVNDRVVDGKKTLFIEEIQSDWHQAGRKKGYDTPEARAAEQQKLNNILVERQALLDEQRRLEELAQPFTSQGKDAPREIVDQWSIVSNRLNSLQTEQNRLGRGFGQQVPDAPFKTTWHELALKRAIQEASEKGYDQIAFTTGKTQAERYDLSKQVDSIVYGKEDDGTYSLVAIKDGRELVKRDSIAESALPDVVGKEVANRMVANEGKRIPGGPPEWELSGENLRVGGEGMKGFYDNILPKSLDKLAKKFDAKVGKTEMDGVEVWQMDITPQMRESVVTKGQPLFAIPAIGAGLLGAGMMQEEEQF